MTITYSLAPIPKWVMINNEGTTAGGAKLYTKRSLNKVQDKTVYQDPAGTIPWTNPILFDANGTQGPFYWAVDSAALDDTYYLEAYDSNNELLWTLDGYDPAGGSGGGGSTTTYVQINNLASNSTFLDHIDNTANPTNTTNLVIAPSNHHGFTPALINPVVGTNGVVGEDIRFVKNNTAATDQITFPVFALGLDPLIGDVTPNDYLRYQCTNSPAGETYKAFQFPIVEKVNNLDNQTLTFTMWGMVAVTPVTLTLYVRQYFGSGGAPSPEVLTSVGTITLSTTWTKYVTTFAVPNTAGKTLGTCGDDAMYIWVGMPLGSPCDVGLTKTSLFLGNINPGATFNTYDQIDSVVQSPRVGQEMETFRSSPPRGWITADDGSIGGSGSGATNRANQDTFCLYKTLWDTVSDTYAPVSTGRGASAVADFSAGKTLTLPLSLGRLVGAAGAGAGLTARVIGQSLGSETISLGAMPAHNHTIPGAVENYCAGGGASTYNTTGGHGPTNTSTVGSGAADGNMPPSRFRYVYIKL